MVESVIHPKQRPDVDRRVVDRAVWGDRLAFETLIRHYDPALRRFALRLVGDEVDDVLQEAYLRAHRALRRFDNGDERIAAWLHRIVYNAAIDALRRRRRDGVLLDVDARGVAAPPPPEARLEEILASLPTEMRAATLLVDAWGFTYQEAALILDVPAGTVASRLHRARAALGRSIEAQRMGGEP